MKRGITCALLAISGGYLTSPAYADNFTQALTTGKVNADFRLRYENVEQDNALKDADALTLRTLLGYTTGNYYGFSAMIEFEDSRTVLGMDDYNDGNGSRPEYSTIVDPETTELDQGFLQYKNKLFTAKVGRQVIALDNQRFVGHVGWRQDRQTFDAVSAMLQPVKDLKMTYAYIDQRNRIFADEKDIDAKDHVLNASYQTAIGTLTGYGYLLEEDNNVDNSLDTWGIRFNGKSKIGNTPVLYTAEWATQESENGGVEFDADYFLIEGGIVFSGVTAKLGYEVLGSDDGNFGFSTPLATLHAFNGWTDQFLTTPQQGLSDMYVSLSGKVMGGSLSFIYHDFEADESAPGIDDFGDEIDINYAFAFNKHYNAGIKLGFYSAGDSGTGKVDTDKIWAWVGAKF